MPASAGIETVYQDLALFDNLTPAKTSLPAASSPARLAAARHALPQHAADGRARRSNCSTGSRCRCRSSMRTSALMSGGQRQAVAVARATVFARKVVILDEPTAALGLREVAQGARPVAQLRDEGNAVILITHNMEHVVELADRAVVLRQGRKVGELVPTRTISRSSSR